MKNGKHIIGIMVSFLVAFSTNAELEKKFQNPPDEYRSSVIWEWCNGMINKESATADLEAMARTGLGGARIFNVGGPEGPVRFASKEWYEIVAHALREADRLGLQLSMNMTEGFCAAGGPWITPEMSMQYVVWSETEVNGPGKVSVILERPDDGPLKTGTLKLGNIGYYKDIKVLAVPKVATRQIKFLGIKKGLKAHREKNRIVKVKTPEHSVAAADIIPRSQVIDLTDRMDKNGKLNWNVPAGKWTILRMGSASTGACTRPGNEKTRGLEADKLNREAVKLHFDSLCKPLLEMEGVKPGKNLIYFSVDSWEADGQNWSPVLADEFKKRRGYSLYPFLPVLTGRIVDSVDVSERFLYDFRRTIADCIRDNFYAYLTELCHQYGMKFASESFSRAAFDGMEVTELIDIPIATFWNRGSHYRAYEEGKWASSAVHVTGKKKVSSEAFPAGRWDAAWVHYPWTYKWLADYAYSSGVNHLAFHCFPFQPWDDKAVHKPGMVFKNWGSQYSRYNTWWEQGVDWQKYQARCQYMLQQGVFQAEALFMTPECVPGLELTIHPDLPLGYDFDLASAKMVNDQLFVEDGMICTPSGMKYHLLCLPKIEEISVPLLKKIQKLVVDGAHVVVSSKPKTSLGLENYPMSKKEVIDIVTEMWQNLDGKKVTEVSYGKGKLYWATPREVLKKIGVEPDVIVETEGNNIEQSSYRAQLPLTYIHRYTPEADLFFVASSSEKPSSGLLSFRIRGKQPEFWYPDSGRIKKCPVYEEKGARTIIPMIFDPAGAYFVVFRKKAETTPVIQVSLNGKPALSTAMCINPLTNTKQFFKTGGFLRIDTADGKRVEEKIKPVKICPLNTDWMVSFEGVGAPESRKFPVLYSWHESPDELLRYFSGTGIYKKTVKLEKKDNEQIWLDLGRVEVIASVIINGKKIEIKWKPPFLTNITNALKSGKNELEIRVANLWGNRLIGDEQYPDDMGFSPNDVLLRQLPKWFVENKPRPQQGRKTFTTCRYYDKNDPLRPSGLLGPVSLITRSKSKNPLIEQIANDLFVFSRNPDYFSYGWHRKAPYWKDVVRKRDKKTKSAKN